MTTTLLSVTGLAISVAGCVAGGWAVWLSFKATNVPVTPTWAEGPHPSAPVDQGDYQDGVISGLWNAVTQSGSLNKQAAIWGGVAVGLNLVGAAVQFFGPN